MEETVEGLLAEDMALWMGCGLRGRVIGEVVEKSRLCTSIPRPSAPTAGVLHIAVHNRGMRPVRRMWPKFFEECDRCGQRLERWRMRVVSSFT